MQVAATVFSVLLALMMAGSGIAKLLNHPSAAARAEHLGVSTGLNRFIGVCEAFAAAGLFVGIVVHGLAITTAAAICALLLGGIGYHVRAHDPVKAMTPALVLLTMAFAIIVLALDV